MATNKERIEALEAGLGGVQDGMQWLEDTVNRLSEILLSTRESSNNHNNGREGIGRPHREDGGWQIFFSKMAKTDMFEKFKMMLGVIDFTIRIKIKGDCWNHNPT